VWLSTSRVYFLEISSQGGKGGGGQRLILVLFSYADVWEYRQLGARDSGRVHPESSIPDWPLFLLLLCFFFFFSSSSYILWYPPGNPFIKRDQRSGKYPAERCMYGVWFIKEQPMELISHLVLALFYFHCSASAFNIVLTRCSMILQQITVRRRTVYQKFVNDDSWERERERERERGGKGKLRFYQSKTSYFGQGHRWNKVNDSWRQMRLSPNEHYFWNSHLPGDASEFHCRVWDGPHVYPATLLCSWCSSRSNKRISARYWKVRITPSTHTHTSRDTHTYSQSA